MRLYLGDDDCTDYWGDDWNDRPYEHNAGTVYDRYVEGAIDVVVCFDGGILEASDDWHYSNNTPLCKEDFKNEDAPCLIVVPPELYKNRWDSYYYSEMLGSRRVVRIYYNQKIDEKFVNKLSNSGCQIINILEPVKTVHDGTTYESIDHWKIAEAFW